MPRLGAQSSGQDMQQQPLEFSGEARRNLLGMRNEMAVCHHAKMHAAVVCQQAHTDTYAAGLGYPEELAPDAGTSNIEWRARARYIRDDCACLGGEQLDGVFFDDTWQQAHGGQQPERDNCVRGMFQRFHVAMYGIESSQRMTFAHRQAGEHEAEFVAQARGPDPAGADSRARAPSRGSSRSACRGLPGTRPGNAMACRYDRDGNTRAARDHSAAHGKRCGAGAAVLCGSRNAGARTSEIDLDAGCSSGLARSNTHRFNRRAN